MIKITIFFLFYLFFGGSAFASDTDSRVGKRSGYLDSLRGEIKQPPGGKCQDSEARYESLSLEYETFRALCTKESDIVADKRWADMENLSKECGESFSPVKKYGARISSIDAYKLYKKEIKFVRENLDLVADDGARKCEILTNADRRLSKIQRMFRKADLLFSCAEPKSASALQLFEVRARERVALGLAKDARVEKLLKDAESALDNDKSGEVERAIYAIGGGGFICNPQQKEKFEEIVNDLALVKSVEETPISKSNVPTQKKRVAAKVIARAEKHVKPVECTSVNISSVNRKLSALETRSKQIKSDAESGRGMSLRGLKRKIFDLKLEVKKSRELLAKACNSDAKSVERRAQGLIAKIDSIPIPGLRGGVALSRAPIKKDRERVTSFKKATKRKVPVARARLLERQPKLESVPSKQRLRKRVETKPKAVNSPAIDADNSWCSKPGGCDEMLNPSPRY